MMDARMRAFSRLTTELTTMFASERSEFGDSPVYAAALELVSAGRDAEAVELVLQFRSDRGDAWRQRAFESGLIDSPEYVRSV